MWTYLMIGVIFTSICLVVSHFNTNRPYSVPITLMLAVPVILLWPVFMVGAVIYLIDKMRGNTD